MAGIPKAMEARRRFGIKIISGVEISSLFGSRDSGSEEPVHILAYYDTSGPAMYDELEDFLVKIRDGRFVRGREMVLKLNKLKIPLNWEHVTRIAGKDVAPGRLDVAGALLEAGYVENLRQAGPVRYRVASDPILTLKKKAATGFLNEFSLLMYSGNCFSFSMKAKVQSLKNPAVVFGLQRRQKRSPATAFFLIHLRVFSTSPFICLPLKVVASDMFPNRAAFTKYLHDSGPAYAT